MKSMVTEGGCGLKIGESSKVKPIGTSDQRVLDRNIRRERRKEMSRNKTRR